MLNAQLDFRKEQNNNVNYDIHIYEFVVNQNYQSNVNQLVSKQICLK